MSDVNQADAARRARILIEPAELAARLDEPGLVVLDAQVELPSPRFDGDYRVASGYDGWLAQRVPGARHADLTVALAAPHEALSFMRPTPQALARGLGALGVGSGSQIAIYDRSDGFWAARLWWMLRWIGIDARVLDGGWRTWCEANLPVESGPQDAPQSAGRIQTYERPRAGMWADRADVEAIVAGRKRATLVCALSADMFKGRAASRYARRGHIPGSVNLPARNLFDASGRYASIAALREALGPFEPGVEACIYCGGGISAAVDALALTLTGHDAVSIYDGSLQEWAADPALPMVST